MRSTSKSQLGPQRRTGFSPCVMALCLWFASSVFGPSITATAQPTKPQENTLELRTILNDIDRLWFGVKSTAEVAMTVKTPRYERVLRLSYWVDGKDHTLIKITSPAKEKGTLTLKTGPDIYNYLPRIGRTVKVSAALRSGSWMGSHFTNDDLLKATRFADDYDADVLQREHVESQNIWTIKLTPKADAAVPWSSIIMVLNYDTKIPRSLSFIDEKGTEVRKLTYDKLKELGGRHIPSRVLVTVASKPDEYTELIYERIDRNVHFDAEFFAVSRLKNH